MMKRTYIDASVMIAAFRGDESTARRAMAVLDDPERTLVVSDYLRLEVTPKPTFYNKSEEVNFMLVIFEKAAESVHPSTDPKRAPPTTQQLVFYLWRGKISY